MNNAKWLSREQGQGTGGGWWRGEALKKKMEVNMTTDINHSQLWVVDWHYYVILSTYCIFKIFL